MTQECKTADGCTSTVDTAMFRYILHTVVVYHFSTCQLQYNCGEIWYLYI